jgi:hypothetical protein
MRRCIGILLVVVFGAVLTGCGAGQIDAGLPPVDPDGPAVAIRPENLVVLPGTGPLTHVQVQNLRNETYRGTIHLTVPDGWKLDAASKPVTIPPRQLARVPFAIEKGIDAESNSYPVRVRAVGGGGEVVWNRPIVAVSTPYYKPAIDGKLEDWALAIPFTFVTGGKKTVVSTYWSRRNFSLLVAVEEDAHKPTGDGPFDAVQIALSPADAKTPRSPSGKAQRYEMLLTSDGSGGKCFLLARPGEAVSAGQKARPLAGRELAGAQLQVFRAKGVTYYECAIPLQAMPAMRAEPGREYRFSLLVHDPGGTGLRDWGRAVGLWPWQRNRLAWSRWPGAVWLAEPPYDNKIEGAFCSSKQ